MKKALIYSLSLALLLSLTACHRAQAEQQGTNQPEPAAVSTPADISTPEPEKHAVPEQLSSKAEPSEITHDELIEVFEKEYEISKGVYNSDSEDTIQGELLAIQFTVDSMDKSLPSDYEAQYRAWRPSVVQQTEQAAPEVELTFTEVTEQVWAVDTVNIRSGPSTNDDKVGQLAKGNSVTRVGIGTGDYADWSRVQLSDGSIVYVASSYLTTTKPTTQTSTATQTQTQTKPSGGTQQAQGNYSSDGMDLGPDPSQYGKGISGTDSPDPWAGSDLLIGYGS